MHLRVTKTNRFSKPEQLMLIALNQARVVHTLQNSNKQAVGINESLPLAGEPSNYF